MVGVRPMFCTHGEKVMSSKPNIINQSEDNDDMY